MIGDEGAAAAVLVPVIGAGGSGLARLLAGGRHVRLLVAGNPPPGVAMPPADGFERFVQVVWPSQVGPIVADALRLPFYEAVFDRALVTTPLPLLAAKASLREVWRVLAPAGLAVFVVKARRPWQGTGWSRKGLEGVLGEAMFEVLDWQVAAVPDRWHLVLVGKRDGLRPAMIGRVDAVESLVGAT